MLVTIITDTTIILIRLISFVTNKKRFSSLKKSIFLMKKKKKIKLYAFRATSANESFILHDT